MGHDSESPMGSFLVVFFNRFLYLKLIWLYPASLLWRVEHTPVYCAPRTTNYENSYPQLLTTINSHCGT